MHLDEIVRNADNLLPGHGRPTSIKTTLAHLGATLTGEEYADRYGEGAYIAQFETEVADLLGKPAAVFMPSGTMAQQIALRIHCEQQQNFTVAMHPTSHLEFAEHAGLQFLHGILRLQFGAPELIEQRMLERTDFEQLGLRPGALLLELPYRPLGGQLPAWDELKAIADWASANAIPMHLDGARIWQCSHFYDKTLAEICALFSSVYVSFYKDLGGIAGCVLAGDRSFIDAARIWQRRHGGNLPDQGILVAAARHGLRSRLPAIGSWVTRASAIASEMTKTAGVRVNPDPPHVNFFQVYLPGEADALTARHHALAQETGTFLFAGLRPAAVPGYAMTEIHCFENSLDFDLDRLVPFLEKLLS